MGRRAHSTEGQWRLASGSATAQPAKVARCQSLPARVTCRLSASSDGNGVEPGSDITYVRALGWCLRGEAVGAYRHYSAPTGIMSGFCEPHRRSATEASSNTPCYSELPRPGSSTYRRACAVSLAADTVCTLSCVPTGGHP